MATYFISLYTQLAIKLIVKYMGVSYRLFQNGHNVFSVVLLFLNVTNDVKVP